MPRDEHGSQLLTVTGALLSVCSLAMVWTGTERLASGAESSTLQKGEAIFRTGFEAGDENASWRGTLRYESGYQSQRALSVECLAGQSDRGATVQIPFPVERVRGCTIRGTAMVKAAAVSDRPNPWNGVKFMLAVETPNGKQWPQADLPCDDFDWTRAAFTVRVPPETTSAHLLLGLEQVTGKVWFDNVAFTVAKPAQIAKPTPAPGPTYRGHDLARLRGVMVSPRIDAEGLLTLGRDWKANLIRFQLIRHGRPGQLGSLDDYDSWLEGELQRLDAVLPLCEQQGIFVVVDLHSPPGGKATTSGYMGSDASLFTDRAVQDKFVDVWRRIARRYRGARPIWGFDLANEPVEEFVEEGCDDWHDLAERAARAVREIDPDRTLIVEAPPWGSPESLADFVPLDVPRVVYSAHMYLPGAFTHQGVSGRNPQPVKYPGEIEGKFWDKAALEAALQPVVDFQRTYNVHIYIGEFSAIRWAPDNSAHRYLRDVIDIFEQHNWDWSYHAFREWQGWSVEHGSDRDDAQPSVQPTDRQQLLRQWFGKNQKPLWSQGP
jgi:hypothetical protein